jgi:hypothetical protein
MKRMVCDAAVISRRAGMGEAQAVSGRRLWWALRSSILRYLLPQRCRQYQLAECPER